METFTFSKLIGETIEAVRYTYNAENEYCLQEFHSYFKLGNGIIIDFRLMKKIG